MKKKKNIIIGVLSITSIFFFIAAYVQKTQNEKLEIQLIEAVSMASMYREEALVAKELAEKQLELARESALRAEKSAKKAMEGAQNAQ